MANISIYYTLIARGADTVLVEVMNASGNFPQITRNLLKKIEQNTRRTILYNVNPGQEYHFHYINENSFTYLCMTESSFSKRAAVAFLECVREEFLRLPEAQRTKGIDYSLNDQLGPFIKDKSYAYSTDKNLNSDLAIQNVKRELSETKDIMVQNIDKLLEREEKIELLVKKTATMNNLSSNIKKNATQIRRDQYWRNIKMKVLLVVVIILVIYFLAATICGLTLSRCF
eukprot:TRINITY_DN7716_c0_g1_i1.p1 TRINITY_DN7716_c0_g1~~TRINITY_DN7716_c0_g1_i1.p1  ORF type:complete len:229 (-),score=65.65 TRINITY_DN7716_c0_g1_i1:83-769(-)